MIYLNKSFSFFLYFFSNVDKSKDYLKGVLIKIETSRHFKESGLVNNLFKCTGVSQLTSCREVVLCFQVR